MFKVAIIDDERKAAEVLEHMVLDAMEGINELKIFTQPQKVAEAFLNWQPDLVFLDIKMPGLNGFELLKLLDQHHFEVVFVTAYDEYALQAIKASALDYLLKPVDEDELIHVITKFKNQARTNTLDRIENYIHNTKTSRRGQFRISISNMERTLFFEMDEIIRCTAQSNYTFFYFQDGSKLLSSKTLKDHSDIMTSKGFLRIHKSHLINPIYIKAMIGKSELEMKDGSIIPIARRRRTEVFGLLSKIIS